MGDPPLGETGKVAGRREVFRTRRLVLTIYLPTLLFALGTSMLGPALPLYAQAQGLPFGLIGLVAAAQGVGAVVANIPAGLLAARIGGRVTMSIGAGIGAAGSLAVAASGGPVPLLLAVPLLGVGAATWATARLTFVAEAAATEERGRALALVGGASRIGMAAGPVLGGFLTAAFGLEAAFLANAAAAAVALTVVQLQSAETRAPRRPAGDSAPRRVLDTLVEHRRPLAAAGSVALSLGVLRNARRIFVPLWGAALGLDLAEIGLVVGLGAAVDMTLFYPAGVVMDRYGRKWTIVPCLVVLSLALALVPFTVGFASLLAVALLGGLGNGLGSGAIMTMGADLTPPHRAGEFLGIWRVIADSGGVVSPVLAGGLAQTLSLAAAFPSVAAIGAVGAIMMVFAVPEGLRRTAG